MRCDQLGQSFNLVQEKLRRQPNCRKWMKGREFRDSMTITTAWDNGYSERGVWIFHDNGHNRIVYRCAHSNLVLKLHPKPSDGCGQNREEYNTFSRKQGLSAILPKVHGLVLLSIEGVAFEGIILDRVAWTVEALFFKLQEQPPGMKSASLVAYIIWLVLDTGAEMAGPVHQIKLTDWHVQNLGITDTEPVTVQLLDWVNHSYQPQISGLVVCQSKVTVQLGAAWWPPRGGPADHI